MTLSVKLELSKTELLVGEEPASILTLENTGREPLRVVHPDGEGGMPCYRVIQTATGAETFVRGRKARGGSAMMLTLEPGRRFQSYVPLLRDVELKFPGEYAISVVYAYNEGRDQAESAAVRVKVRALSVSNLMLDSVRGTAIDGVFVNPAADPADVVWAHFSLTPGGGLQGLRPVGKAALTARPCVGLPPNKASASGNWVAWLEQEQLQFAYSGLAEGLMGNGSVRLPAAQAEIIPPVYLEPSGRGADHRGGAVLVWVDGVGSESSFVQAIELEPGGGKARGRLGAKAVVGGARPKWMMSQVRSDGTRLVTFLRSGGENLGLYVTDWPDGRAPSAAAPRVMEWKGELVTAGATMSLSDDICGAVLLWSGQGQERVLQLIGWQISSKGAVREHYRETLPWGARTAVGAALVRVRPSGVPAVLLRPADYIWSVWDGFKKELVPVPEAYRSTRLPMELAFCNPEDVVLLCAEPAGGFSARMMDGNPLPSFPK
jgi:hypothetical protein